MPFLDGLFVSSLPRAYLENMQSGRSRGGVSKILPTGEIEARLDKIVRIHGDEKLNELRDNARETAGELGMEKEFQALDKLIGALLRARPDHELVTPLAAVRAAGSPYDPDRLNLFQELFSALKGTELHVREEIEYTPEAFRNMAFFEAYFSNYIEGTAFELEETQEIVWQGKIPSNRPADAHDILGTYKIVANTQEMLSIALDVGPDMVSLVPENPGEVTTEGGLNVTANEESLKQTTAKLKAAGIHVSFFIDPIEQQIDASKRCGAESVELCTARYSEASLAEEQFTEFEKIAAAARHAAGQGLGVNVGHGLDYQNTAMLAALPEVEDFNTGHAIIIQAIFDGLHKAVADMVKLVKG